MTGKFPSIARAHVQTVKTGQMQPIKKRPYKKAFKAQNQMVLYKRPKYVSLTNPPSKPMKLEKKNVDILSGNTLSVGTGVWTNPQILNLLGNGAGPTARIGRRVTMKSLQIRFTAVAGNQAMRLMVCYDKQTNGALPAITDVVTSSGDFNAVQNLGNNQRFVVLCDQIFISISNVQAIADTIYRKINLDSEYFATATSTIADMSTGSVFIMVASLQPPAIGVTQCSFTSRIRFTDV